MLTTSMLRPSPLPCFTPVPLSHNSSTAVLCLCLAVMVFFMFQRFGQVRPYSPTPPPYKRQSSSPIFVHFLETINCLPCGSVLLSYHLSLFIVTSLPFQHGIIPANVEYILFGVTSSIWQYRVYETIKLSPRYGLRCLNSRSQSCKDYEVRYYCGDYPTLGIKTNG